MAPAHDIREFDDLDEALAQSPEIMFVTNPNSKHMQVALAGARAGCHLFIEKPMSDSLDGIQDLGQVAAAGVVALVGFQFRFHPGIVELRKIVEQTMGEVLAAHVVNGEFLPDWPPYEDYRQTSRYPGFGGRVVTDPVTRARLRLLDLRATSPTLRRRRTAHLLEVVETASSGGRIDASSRSGRRPPRLRSVPHAVRARSCSIEAERPGTTTPRLDVVPREGERSTRSYEGFARNEMFVIELRHFLECVRGNERPLVDLREAEASLRVALAAERSLRTRRAGSSAMSPEVIALVPARWVEGNSPQNLLVIDGGP